MQNNIAVHDTDKEQGNVMNSSPNRGTNHKEKHMNAFTKATSAVVLVALGFALTAQAAEPPKPGTPPRLKERRTFYLTARGHLVGSSAANPTDPKIIKAAQEAGLPLISGPMLGDVSESSITVWFRPVAVEALTVQVKAKEGGEKKEFLTKVSQPGAVTRVGLTDLAPNTPYTCRIITGTGGVLGEGAFRTAPKPNTKETIRIAFGADFHKGGIYNPNLMRLIAERGNHAMLLLGNLAVIDREVNLNMHYDDYLPRDVSIPWRQFSANIPVYASWDDHDYLNNDKSGLQKGQISDKERNDLRKLWQDNWVIAFRKSNGGEMPIDGA